MKKLLLAIVIIALGFSASAQNGNFNVGVNLGLPTGDAGDFYTFGLGLEVNYLFEVSETFDVGPSISYTHFFGDDVAGIEIDDASFLPIAAAARFNASEKFVIGADIGYAVGISPSENDGGFYYKPLVGFNVSEQVMLQAYYSGVNVDGGTNFDSFGIGAMFKL